jgi:hypothetical protein
LPDPDGVPVAVENTRHKRRILVENTRHKRLQKAGHGRQRRPLEDVEATVGAPPDDLLALDDALTKLGRENQAAADLAKLRLFTGLTVDEAEREGVRSPFHVPYHDVLSDLYLADPLRPVSARSATRALGSAGAGARFQLRDPLGQLLGGRRLLATSVVELLKVLKATSG